MTRKDFQMIADVVKMIDNKDTRHTVAMNFAVKLKGEPALQRQQVRWCVQQLRDDRGRR